MVRYLIHSSSLISKSESVRPDAWPGVRGSLFSHTGSVFSDYIYIVSLPILPSLSFDHFADMRIIRNVSPTLSASKEFFKINPISFYKYHLMFLIIT